MRKIIKLTESDLVRIVKRVLSEQEELPDEMFSRPIPSGMYSRESAPKGIENQVLRMIQDEVKEIEDQSSSSYDFDSQINELLMSWEEEIEELSEREYRMLMGFIEDISTNFDEFSDFYDEEDEF
jgi:archaellum component FlaC